MESSTYIPQISKKRVFPGSSTMEPVVMEIVPPSADQISVSNSILKDKQKEKVTVDHSNSFKGINLRANNYLDLDDYDDYDDDDDDYSEMQAYYDKMDLPTGVEAPIPSLPDKSQKKMKPDAIVAVESSTYIPQNSKKRVFPGSSTKEPVVMKIVPPSDQIMVSNSMAKGKQKEKVTEDHSHSFKGINLRSNNYIDLDDDAIDDDYWAMQAYYDKMDLPTGVEAPIQSVPDTVQKKMKPSANSLATSKSQRIGVGPLSTHTWLPSSKKDLLCDDDDEDDFIDDDYFDVIPHSNLKQVPSIDAPYNYTQSRTVEPIGVDTMISEWQKLIMKNHVQLNDADSSSGVHSVYGKLFGQNDAANNSSPKSSSLVGSFKKFDTVEDFSDHLYAKKNLDMNQPPKSWAKKIQDEWRILEKDLPDTIFVRVYESRMDLLRAAIIGAEGTPYHDGLFFFDVCFPSDYPKSPPLVLYHSRGLRINPNLYNCGKVCLSLLNTWSGKKEEKWLPGTSTMLQVLVSIQGLILNTNPYFNEPGTGSGRSEKPSVQYNENTLILSLKTMVYNMNKPPKHFEDLMVGHFRIRVRDILMACKAYTEGLQVGRFIKGGVQDIKKSKNSCSDTFKKDVATYIKTLIDAFCKIGANEAVEFIHLSEKIIPSPVHNRRSNLSGAYFGFP